MYQSPVLEAQPRRLLIKACRSCLFSDEYMHNFHLNNNECKSNNFACRTHVPTSCHLIAYLWLRDEAAAAHRRLRLTCRYFYSLTELPTTKDLLHLRASIFMLLSGIFTAQQKRPISTKTKILTAESCQHVPRRRAALDNLSPEVSGLPGLQASPATSSATSAINDN